MSDNPPPTLRSWLRDGAQLLGLDEQRQAQLKAQANSMADKTAQGIETLERNINGLESKARDRLKAWRERQS